MADVTERLSNDARLNTPALLAQGFAESVQELQEEGKLRSPEAIAFLNAAVAMMNAMSTSPNTEQYPEPAREVMKRSSLLAIMAAGFADGLLSSKPTLN